MGRTRGDKGAALGRLDLLTSEGLRTIHLLSSHNRRVCQDEVSARAAWLAANMLLSPDFIEINLPNTRRYHIFSAAAIDEKIYMEYSVEPKREES